MSCFIRIRDLVEYGFVRGKRAWAVRDRQAGTTPISRSNTYPRFCLFHLHCSTTGEEYTQAEVTTYGGAKVEGGFDLKEMVYQSEARVALAAHGLGRSDTIGTRNPAAGWKACTHAKES